MKKRYPWMWLLAFVLVLGCVVTLTAVKSDAATAAIPEGQAYPVTLAPGEGKTFTFTPSKTGYYYTSTPLNEEEGTVSWLDFRFAITITDGSSEDLALCYSVYREGNAETAYSLTAGKTYTVTVTSNIEYFSETDTRNVTIAPYAQVEELSINMGMSEFVLWYTPGMEYHVPEALSMEFSPMNSFSEITWTSSDPSVFKVKHGNPYGCAIEPVGSGSATLTAAAKNGVSASIMITVKESETLCLNQVKSIYLEPGENSRYSFTVAETGYYAFISQFEDGLTPYINIKNSQYNTSCDIQHQPLDNGECTILYLEEGAYYDAGFWHESYYSDPVIGSVKLQKATKPTSIVFSEPNYTLYTSEEFADHNYVFQALPIGSYAEYTVAASDPDVVEVAQDTSYMTFMLNPKKVGTATLTLTSDNGLKATATVTVKEPEKLKLDTPIDLSLTGGQSVKYTLTVNETGYYSFNSTLLQDPLTDAHTYFDFWIVDSAGEYLLSDHNTMTVQERGAYVYLTAGTYGVDVFLQNDVEVYSGTISVTRVPEPSKISFAHGVSYTFTLGDTMGRTLWTQFAPENTYSYVEYTSSNESVACVEAGHDNMCYLQMIAPGTTTITATTRNGLQATCSVTVTEPTPIKLGETKTVSLTPRSNIGYQLTITESGYYGLSATNQNCYIAESTSDYPEMADEFFNAYKDDGSAISYYDLTPGVYTVIVNNYSTKASDVTVSIAKCAVAQSISFPEKETTLFLDNEQSNGKTMVPTFSPAGSVGKVTYTSSNSDVVVTEYDSIWPVGLGTATVTATLENGKTATITVHVEPYVAAKITKQPTDITATATSQITLSVTATGCDLEYQWQYRTSSAGGWMNAIAAGNNTSSMTVPAAGKNGFQYRCIIYNSYGDLLSTNEITIKLVEGPSIIQQPTNITAGVGTNAIFSVKASGTGLTYQWQYKVKSDGIWMNALASGNQTVTMTVPVTQSKNGYQYRCAVKNGDGAVSYTDVVTLTVKAGPAITTQPTNQTVAVGQNAIFSVKATGTNLSYQWEWSSRANGAWAAAGATGNKTATMSVTGTTGRNGLYYRCKVTDGSGGVTYSNAALLSVTAEPAGNVTITTQPTNQTVMVGENAIFTVKANGTNLSYQWEWSSSANGAWTAAGATGNKTATMSVTGTTGRNGLYYRCKITDGSGGVTYTNAVLLTVTAEPAGNVTITTQPTNQTVKVGENAIFTVKANGINLSYQWEWSSSANGAWTAAGATGNKTATLRVAGTTARNGLYYRCKITDGNGGVTYSNAALLTVTAANGSAITQQPTDQTVAIGETAIFAVKATGVNLTYQWEWRAGSNGVWANATASGNKTATLEVPGIAARNNFQYRCKITDANGAVIYSVIVTLKVN